MSFQKKITPNNKARINKMWNWIGKNSTYVLFLCVMALAANTFYGIKEKLDCYLFIAQGNELITLKNELIALQQLRISQLKDK